MATWKKALKIFLIAALWVGVWYAVYALVGNALLFPAPHTVAARLFELLGTKDFYLTTGRSLWNILCGILVALVLGCLLSLLGGVFPIVGDVLRPFMAVVKATPVASFIILLLIFIGAATVPSVVTVLIVLPILWGNLDEGLRQIDQNLREVTTVYRFPPAKRFRVLVLPSILPYFKSAMKSALGLAWKAGVAAEIIAMPRGTIGTAMGNAKQYIETVDLFAWTLTVILFSVLIEFALKKLLERLFEKRKEVPRASH